MKGTIYGNGLPRSTQVDKRLGTAAVRELKCEQEEVDVIGGLLSSLTVIMWRLLLAEVGKPANGDGPHKKHSVTESLHLKLKAQQPEIVEEWVLECVAPGVVWRLHSSETVYSGPLVLVGMKYFSYC
jgi:hypothetical protein